MMEVNFLILITPCLCCHERAIDLSLKTITYNFWKFIFSKNEFFFALELFVD